MPLYSKSLLDNNQMFACQLMANSAVRHTMPTTYAGICGSTCREKAHKAKRGCRSGLTERLFYVYFLVKMKNWIIVAGLSFSILGCFSEDIENTGVTMTTQEVQSLVARDITLYEKNLKLSGRMPTDFEQNYKKPHLVRLYEASVFFRNKAQGLERLHEKKMISLDRKILDAKKEELDSGIKSEKLRILKRERGNLQVGHNKSLKMLKGKEKDRINYLNEQYLAVLKADF